MDTTNNDVFDLIYREDVWDGGSGPGSRPHNTIEYRAFLERFLHANAIGSVTDLGCGDWQFSKHIDWSGIAYTGLDVVAAVIARNTQRYAADNVVFRQLGGPDDLPGGDLLIAKEVLQHLPNADIARYLPAIRARYRFALLTNAAEPRELANLDIQRGAYRPLDLRAAPFDVPGAVVFTYHPQAGAHLFRNAVLLVMGSGR